MAKTRPEIYTMGHRNPYRISVDKHTGYLYWGEVGPDASVDSAQRGPMGHDEVNQAKKPGNYGWPYFVGDNKAYFDYDFATKTPGAQFDAAHPVNESPNNTGAARAAAGAEADDLVSGGEEHGVPARRLGRPHGDGRPGVLPERLPQRGATVPAYYDGSSSPTSGCAAGSWP
jgi:cytochrome c